jgi:ankyrin repeat protein
MTALHWACELNYIGIVDLLVRNRARVDCEDIKGHTPIDLCILKDNHDTLKYLIDHVDISFCYYKLLFAAVENFNYGILRYFSVW